MNTDTQALALQALDMAFTQHVSKLFGVVMSDPSDAGIRRFLAGLYQSADVHEKLHEAIEEGESHVI